MIASFLFKGLPETRTPLSIGEFFSNKGSRNATPFDHSLIKHR